VNALKAIVAGILAAATAIAVPTALHPWSYWSLLGAAIAGLGTFQAVYWTPNKVSA
jgi:hypothetical protein